MKKDTKKLLWGFAAGSAVGSALGLLLAPKSGKELRQQIAEETSAGLEKAQDLAARVEEKTSDWYARAKDSALQIRDELAEWKNRRCAEDGREIQAEVSGQAEAEAGTAASPEEEEK
ncbi:YtxH domain-containing protein [Paenibacillus glufosinatiresistens]|uniref:YtxH domain-containing protein n=1 Tax=Paenibacillus glufosinatiresistens TaxID=3070657 RepID=UPI00286D8EBB|nr:YtxH domain-containing protein [Paenibacillus sp. YX.27]